MSKAQGNKPDRSGNRQPGAGPALARALRAFVAMLPILLGMLLLTSLLLTLVPREGLQALFGRHESLDVLLGAVLGSVAAGHPLAGYLLGGELLAGGVSLIAVTALIVTWVSVGIVQLPAEALLLGRRFALTRNLLCFVSAIAIAYLTVGLLRLLG